MDAPADSSSDVSHPKSHLLRVAAANGRELLLAVAPSIHQELSAALDRGDLCAADVYWRALLRCGEAEGAQWSLPPLAALSLCSSLAASCESSPSLELYLQPCIRQCEAMLASHYSSLAPPRLQVADLQKVVKGSQLSSRQVGFMPGFLLVFGGKGDGVRLYPSRCILSERIKTDDTIEVEYIEDDKPSSKQLLSLRAVTSAAASAVLKAIRDVRHGCGGAASLFGESWDALVSASALHSIMDSPDSLAKIRSHFVSSRLFSKLDLDALAPSKPEGILYVARGLAWRLLQLPLAATCDFTWGLTFSKRGDKCRVALQRERLVQLRRLCGHIMEAIKDDDTAASFSDDAAAAQPAKGWAVHWNAPQELKLGVLAIALQWIKRDGAELKQAPLNAASSTRASLSPGDKAVLSDDQVSVASNSTRGAGASDTASVAPSLAGETVSPARALSLDSPPPPSSVLPTLSQTAKRGGAGKRESMGDAERDEGPVCSTQQIVAFLTSFGVALSDYDLFEASDATALGVHERSKVESVKLAKYHEVRHWWEGRKEQCGNEMRLSGMKIQSLAGWPWEGSMNSITSLYLDCNKLKEFSWDWVLLLSQLEILSLEGNRIERIGSFLSKDSCRSLKCLKFGGNCLAKLNHLTETIDPAVGSRIISVTLFGNPFISSLRDEGSSAACDAITAEYTYVSSILAAFPCVRSVDGFALKEAHLWWVRVFSEFNSGAAALCQAMHPCQSTRTLALAPLLSWACTPIACACFTALDGVSAVLPILRYIHDPQAVFCGLMVIRRITAGTNSSSPSALCASNMAPLFWAVLKRAAEEFPDLHEDEAQPPQTSGTSTWTSAWTVSIATLALAVLVDAVFPATSTNRPVSSKALMSTFALHAGASLPDILCAISTILGRGGSVFEPLSRRRDLPAREGAAELERAIAMIWGRPASEEKWVKRLAGVQPLNEGLAASIASSCTLLPADDKSRAAAAADAFTHSDALASAAYFNRLQRATSTAANRRSSLLSSQYSGSLMQSVSKLAKTPNVDPSAAVGATSASDSSNQVRVMSADCSSLIYDCGIALVAVAHEHLKSVAAAACLRVRNAILSAWGSDFRHSKLREGRGRYGEEFAILNELMSHSGVGSAGGVVTGISGTDIVAVGYVAAAAARRSLACLVGGGSSSSSSSHRSLFTVALSAFFRVLLACDNTPGSLDSLKEAAARKGLEMPISFSFIKSCFGGSDDPCAPDDLKLQLLQHLNSCESLQGGSAAARIFLDQELGGGEGSLDVDALVTVASAIVGPDISSHAASLSHLNYWLFRSLTRVTFSSVTAKAEGDSTRDAVATVSLLCRRALFETSDINLCVHGLKLLHHWINPRPPAAPLQLVSFLAQPPPPLSVLCSLLQRAPPSLAISLSPIITNFFATFFSVPERPRRGVPLLMETLKSFSGEHRLFSIAGTAHSSPDFLPVIGAIMQPSPLGASSVLLAGELCVRWDVRGSVGSSDAGNVLRRSAEVVAEAVAASDQAAACGNQHEFEDARDLECCAFVIHARHASAFHIKLFQTVLEKFLTVTSSATSAQLAMACLSSLFILDSFSSQELSEESASLPPSGSGPYCAEFVSALPRNKQFELATDAIMALLRVCRSESDESPQAADVAHQDAAASTMIAVRLIAARLALKASRLDSVAMRKLLLGDTLGWQPAMHENLSHFAIRPPVLILSPVPFLSGLSSSKAGSGSGDGVDASTVSVINEICERALQADVSAAIAAARAVAALVEQCLSAGQTAFASSAMSSLPLLLARLIFSPATDSSLRRLVTSCGTTFKGVLKVICHAGRATTESLESLWKSTFECISVVLCLQPLLASPSNILLWSSVVTPPAAPLLIDALKEEFLPIAMSAVGLSRLIPWKLDDLSQAITSLLITCDPGSSPPPIWWKRGMESVTSNIRDNAGQLAGQMQCPPCIATASCICLALARADHGHSLSADVARIVAFLNSLTHLIDASLSLHDPEASSSSSNAPKSWMVEFFMVVGNVVASLSGSSSSSPAFLVSFVARGAMPCISELSSALCRLARVESIGAAAAEQMQDVVSRCCACYASMMSVAPTLCAPLPTMRLVADVWLHACSRHSKAQRPALDVIAFAISKLGPDIMSDLAGAEINLEAIVGIIVEHIESHRLQSANEHAVSDASALESACQVLSACVSVRPSLSTTLIPREVLLHLCSCGWTWMRSPASLSLVNSVSTMVPEPLQQAVSGVTHHVFGDVLRLVNSSAWIKLVVRLMETNSSHVCDILMDDLSSAAAGCAAEPSVYVTRLLQYSTICSMCGSSENSDEVETAFGFGMGLLFDDAWKLLPPSCHDMIFQRYYLHAFFLSRHIMSKTAVSAEAFSEVLLGALTSTDGGCAAALSLALLLCDHEKETDDNEDFKLEHMTLPGSFAEDFAESLESSSPAQSNGRCLQISLLFRIGTALNWNIACKSEWTNRISNFYARVLVLNCEFQHLLLQTISEVLFLSNDTVPASLSVALIFRTQHLSGDLLFPFGQSLLSQVSSCLKAGFVPASSLQTLLINLLKMLEDDSRSNPPLTHTIILALAAASSVAPSIIAAEVPDIASLFRSAQRHVICSLAAADARGVFNMETFQSVQVLCRSKAADVLIAEGMPVYFLRSFDTGISIAAVQCIMLSLWYAFAPEYSGDAWIRCLPLVSRILLHSNFQDMLVQPDNVLVLAELITNALIVGYEWCETVMPRIAGILDSALQRQEVTVVRKFFDILLHRVPKFELSKWCEEIVVVTARCCGCDDAISDAVALRASACRVIFAISKQNVSVLAGSVVVSHIIKAIEPCSSNPESISLLLNTMLSVAAVSPLLLSDTFPSAILSISLDVIDNFSADVVHCLVQLILSLSTESSSANKQFVARKSLVLLHFFMQKYAVREDDHSVDICMLISQLMLQLSLSPELSEVSSAFSILWNSWRAKFKQKALGISTRPLLPSHDAIAPNVEAEDLFSMKQAINSLDMKLSALDTHQEDMRESLQSIAKMSDVKHMFDAYVQYQQESLGQQQQETLRHQQQQQQQLQLQQSLLQQQQYLLEQLQQQLTQQHRQLEHIALQQQTLMMPIANQASAPPLSIEADEFHMNLHGENGTN